MEPISLVLIAVLVVLVSLWVSTRKGLNPLPGPTGLPFVGYIPFLTQKPYVKLAELAQQYGPVYSVRLGGKNVVVLADFQSIKDAFASDAFMGRPKDVPFDLSETTIRTGALLGMEWKDQRRFSLHMLRDLGFGKSKMEEHLKEELAELLDRMEKLEGLPTKMTEILAPSMSNNIASLLFGRRLKYDDPRRMRLDQVIGDVGRYAGTTSWMIFFPWIGAVMSHFQIGSRGRLTVALRAMRDYCREEIIEHEKTLDPNNIRDYMDGYLLEIKKRAQDPTSAFQKDVLIDLGQGFFGAGSETVRISIDWFLLLCAAFPDVQRRIYQEVREVLGQDRFVSRVDHANMPYTEATILEINRWITLVPLNIMRSTLVDTELNGYFIPKDSDVLAVLWAVHHDKKLWGDDAEDFRPERFLSEDGKKVIKPEYLIPFSIGKRQCPGKVFAEVEVFLYATAILQKFQVSLPPGKEADLEGVLGIGLQPKRQELILKRR